ncbi:MAG: hypothetical protein ACRDK3_11605 [Actinomycetota bacterium]
MSNEVIVALIAATPPAIGYVLWFLAHRRLRRSVGASPEIPLSKLIAGVEQRSQERFDRLEVRLDSISEVQREQGERLARLEANSEQRLWRAGR